MELDTFITVWYLTVACICLPLDIHLVRQLLTSEREPAKTILIPVVTPPPPIPKHEVPKRGAGFVYVLRDVQVTGWCKIGYTVSPKDRIGHFDTMLPFETEVLCLIPDTRYRELERDLHWRFRAKHKRGEWFALDDDDIAAIRRLA